MNPVPLVEASQLRARVGAVDCIAVDCRFDLQAPHAGFMRYLAGHVPGARYAHLDKDLAGAVTQGTGRHPLPSAEDFVRCLGAWGITRDCYVVAYDDAGGAIAARLWWMLRWLGHRECAVLDGGIGAWLAAGHALEATLPVWRESVYAPRELAAQPIVSTAEIEALLAAGARLLDARGAVRFRGEVEPIDPVAGHIPGALNLPFTELLQSDGTLKPRTALATLFGDIVPNASAQNVIAMCGSGVTACHLLLAMELAGLGTGRLYAGSWSEWIRDPRRPIGSRTATT